MQGRFKVVSSRLASRPGGNACVSSVSFRAVSLSGVPGCIVGLGSGNKV